jgi:hypothetical protein
MDADASLDPRDLPLVADPVRAGAADQLLAAVDAFLAQWRAHGDPLTCARDWRDDRFLAVGVDQSTAGASGCSIDGLFRVLQGLEPQLGSRMVGGGRVFYRDLNGEVQSVERHELKALRDSGAIKENSVVFDTSLTDLGSLRQGFERPARKSWAKGMLALE